jgi:hypothetical protein
MHSAGVYARSPLKPSEIVDRILHRGDVVSRTQLVANAILWGAAILASALLGAPRFLTLVLLPSLGTVALIVSRRESVRDATDP